MMQTNRKFFAKRVEMYNPMQIKIAKSLYELWQPKSVFDLGCGIGGYLEGFYKCGCVIRGCDAGYDTAMEYMSDMVKICTFKHDAAQPLNKVYKYELAMSVEVAEHLDEKYADQFCKNLAESAKSRILLTAAGVGQRGKHHVNCQPQEYWIEKMESLGAKLDKKSTIGAIECINEWGDPFGLCKNLMVFTVGGGR